MLVRTSENDRLCPAVLSSCGSEDGDPLMIGSGLKPHHGQEQTREGSGKMIWDPHPSRLSGSRKTDVMWTWL